MTAVDGGCTIEFVAPHTEHIGTKAAFERIAAGLSGDQYDAGFVRVYREWEENSPGRLVTLDSRWSTAAIDRVPYPWKKLVLAGVTFRRLVGHLRRNPPDVLVTGLLGGVVVAAKEAAGADTNVVVSVQGLPQPDRVRSVVWPRTYGRADVIVAPVSSIADRVANIADVDDSHIEIAPNPVVTERLLDRGVEELDHPWFDEETPVIVAVGRQTRQKDFKTLLRAFADIYDDRDARLVVPGKEDEQTKKLRRIVEELSLGDVVSFPGFVDNPYGYMCAADVFVLSSKWEGPGHVLIEALALGTPVVATDCPLGPREVLDDGDAGLLVPVGDHEAMAEGIATVLDDPQLRATNVAAGRAAADRFHESRAVERYREVIAPLCEGE